MKKNNKIAPSTRHKSGKSKTAPKKIEPEIEVLEAPREAGEDEDQNLETLDLLDGEELAAGEVLDVDDDKDAEPELALEEGGDGALPAPSAPRLPSPAGARDSVTEGTSVCAARELEEETGYQCGSLEKLLSLRTTVAFCDEFIDVYLATDLKPGKQHLDEAEDIDVEAYDPEELCAMIYDGTLQDAKTVAGILAYCCKQKHTMG